MATVLTLLRSARSGAVQQPSGTGAGHIHHRGIGTDLLQDGCNRGQALEKVCQFLDSGVGRVVVGGFTAAVLVLVAESFSAGKGQILAVGIEILLKVTVLGGEIDNPVAGSG